MNSKDVIEWFIIADEDFDSAKILNEAAHKHKEIICYHCAQSIEKYLKGYLTYNDIIPKKTHNIILLNETCIEIDHAFEQMRNECGLLNKFTNDIRYPYRIEIKEEDVLYALNAVERIRNIEPLLNLRNFLIREHEIQDDGKEHTNE
ncbi:MAG: HEPN domain-containing protein [Treponema sp.]|jgi:HEPN domain-containing protein|nr:HEPN domain-containing protein [Treponema sp.]